MFGGPDLQIGDREFDALYTVWGQCSQEFARSILTPDVVFIIRELGKSGSVVFTLTPSKVEIRTASSFVSNHAKLLDYAIRIGELLTQTDAPADITFEKGEVQATACQICGSEFKGSLVKCVKCATLHHADCWKFFGQCSTYACGSTNSRPA